MTKTADVVIIGGGVQGCSIAYNLAKRGCRNVVLFEKGYLASGGTGRCGAGVRHQFGTEVNCRLAIENIKSFEHLNEELGYDGDVEFEQGGYLLIAYSEGQLNQFQKNVALQRILGIDSYILTPGEIREVVPALDLEGVLGASYCPKDGHLNPFHTTQAYAFFNDTATTEIYTYTEVTGIKTRDGRVMAVVTDKGEVETRVVVNVAGGHGAVVGQMAGLDIPMYSERHQILVTEPVEHVLDPMVLCFDDGTYWKQTPHGSFLMGIGDPHEVKGLEMRSSWQFLREMAGKITRHMPILGEVRVVRQWAGLYDITPDSQVILGPTPVEGFYVDVGWSGHGFQFAPSAGRVMAEMILGNKPFIDVSVLGYDRFARGALVPEPACV